MRTLAHREQRLARARAASRIEVGLGTMAVIVGVGSFLIAPAYQPHFGGGPPWWTPIVAPGGVVLLLIGYLWMLRIRFTGPEDGARSNWRSH